MNNFNLLNNNINFDNIKKIHLLINYLDDSCSIKKYKQHYIIKKNKKKIIFNDNNFYKDNNLKLSLKKIYIYMFLYNTLDDGWIIKKKLDKYYFKKKYHDQIEVFDSNFLLSFLEENLNLPIKK